MHSVLSPSFHLEILPHASVDRPCLPAGKIRLYNRFTKFIDARNRNLINNNIYVFCAMYHIIGKLHAIIR